MKENLPAILMRLSLQMSVLSGWKKLCDAFKLIFAKKQVFNPAQNVEKRR